ncbi:hypothetical protein [Streptomyces sp. CMSTAAHL-2]|uniref:hypothetical protein n=1 Tax=Streptomyces sp. CMSTAAHL-2 TaxID=2904522 RepID=UPI001E34FC5E|nr:hypothetical protein [Streptomyces sp. CMSTAAHL-2]
MSRSMRSTAAAPSAGSPLPMKTASASGCPPGAVLTRRLCRRYGSHPVTVVWMVVLALSVALRKTLTRT